jgi:sec-independent protein translocase protein TatC
MTIRKAKNQLKKKNNTEKTFLEHLQELKNRFVAVFVIFIIGSIIGYILHKSLIDVLLLYQPMSLIYTSPAGGLDFIIKISISFGLIVSIPVIIYQIFKFLEPILPKNVKISVIKIVLASITLVAIGMAFAYFVCLPTALIFLSKFSSGQIKSFISTNEYFSFVFLYLFGFGILFQLPLVLLLINQIKRLTVKKLLRFERYLIVFSFLIAGILTPTPDLVNQTIMAVPVILLYQMSVLLIWLTNRRQIHDNGKW